MRKEALLFGFTMLIVCSSLVFHSCKRTESRLDFLQEELVNNDYQGKFDKAGRMEKTALGVFGIENRLVYIEDDFFATFIEIKEGRNFQEIKDEVLPMILEHVGQDEKEKIKSIEENIVENDNLIMIYYGAQVNEAIIDVFKNI